MGSSTAVTYTDITWPWRWSHSHQLGQLLESGFKSDFNLILGPQKEKVAVHKIFLQFVSPVLNSRLGKCSAAQLEIEDVDPEIFKLLLKYIYTGDSGMTIIEALPLLKMATDFEITPLADQCAALLKSDITLENVLPLFQGAMEYAHGELIQSTLAFICKNAQKVLKLDNFVNLRLECLIEIIQQDALVVLDEVDVFNAVYRWGDVQQARAPQPIEMRQVLNKPLTHVRFPLMDATEFALNVATKNVLDASELISMLTCFHIPQKQRSILPQGRFPSTPRAYIQLDGELTLSRAPKAVAEKSGKKKVTMTYTRGETVDPIECLMICCDAKVALKGITIPSYLITARGIGNLHYQYLGVNISVNSGDNTWIQNCLPLVNSTDGTHYQINIVPPVKLSSRSQPTFLTVEIRQLPGYQNYDLNGCAISGFGEFVQNPADSEIGLRIQRKDGDELPMTQGFVEKLIFGPI